MTQMERAPQETTITTKTSSSSGDSGASNFGKEGLDIVGI